MTELGFYDGVGSDAPPQQNPTGAFDPKELGFHEGVPQDQPGTVGQGLGTLFSPDTSAIEQRLNENAADTTGNVRAAEMMTGVPALGKAVPWLEKNVVPQSAHVSPERLAAYEYENPLEAGALKGAGSTLSTAPLFAAAPGLAGAMGVGAGVNAADTAAGGGNLDQILTSGATGASGAVIGHFLANPGQLPGKLGKWAANGIPRWNQMPDKVRNTLGKLITLGSLGHAIWHGVNEGLNWADLFEAGAGLGIGAGASAAGHSHAWYSNLIPNAWDAIASVPNGALRAAQSTPVSHAIVKSGITQAVREMNQPEPDDTIPPKQKRGGAVKRKPDRVSQAAMGRSIRRAYRARA